MAEVTEVEALYPSIDLDMALESLAEAHLQDVQIEENTKECTDKT